MVESIPLVADLRNDMLALDKCRGEEKLQRAWKVRMQLDRIMSRAAKDFDFPLLEIQRAKDLLPEVDSIINRLEVVKRRKESQKSP